MEKPMLAPQRDLLDGSKKLAAAGGALAAGGARAWCGALALLVVALAASCADDAGVRIVGRILWPNGAPARGLHIRFSSDTQGGVVDSDADGRYELTVRDSDAQGLFHAYLSTDTGGAMLFIRAESQGPDVEVPTAVVWAPTLRPTLDADGGVEVTWPDVGSDVGSSYAVDVVHEPGAAWWRADAQAATTIRLPAEVLEDHLASVVVSATTGTCPIYELILPRPGAAPGAGACVIQTSSRTQLAAGSAVPVSRGATCATRSGGVEAPLLTQGQPPCPLTDGLAATAMFACPAGGCPEELVLDLGEARTVSAVVVHGGAVQGGASRAVVVETSTDGEAYDPAVTFEPDAYGLYAHAPFDRPRDARFVKLRVDAGSFSGLGDVAVF
jgi:hypothetical protein